MAVEIGYSALYECLHCTLHWQTEQLWDTEENWFKNPTNEVTDTWPVEVWHECWPKASGRCRLVAILRHERKQGVADNPPGG